MYSKLDANVSTTKRSEVSILVVDDEPVNLGVLNSVLQPYFNVRVARSGAEALRVAVTGPLPDLVLLDVMMPEMDGYEVLSKLHELPECRDIPVIFVTATDTSASEQYGLELGAVDYITKPFSEAVVLARVRTQLELKRARDLLSNQNAHLEVEVERREELLHSIATTAQDAIVSMDSDGRISFWNSAAGRIFGYAEEEVLGRALHPLLVPPHFLAAWTTWFADFRASGSGATVGNTVELKALRKDRSEFPIEISIATFKRKDAWQAMGIVRDITTRKRLEADLETQIRTLKLLNSEHKKVNCKLTLAQNQLLQSEKLASIGLLAAGVAHEINNPVGFVSSNLMSLKNYVHDLLALIDAYESAEKKMPGTSTEFFPVQVLKEKLDLPFLRSDVEALMSESRDGLDRVKTIVKSLKDFARMDTEDTFREDDIHQGIESTLKVAWNEIKYKCDVRKEYGDIPPVECLLSHLNQVFMNLLVNAAHAIESRGTITIRTGIHDKGVLVEIADTGKGIPAENLSRIFDPFFTTKPIGQGTGLGLSVSYSIVQKHHGRIEAISEVGKGTTFRVWLPLKQPADAAKSETA